MAGKHTPCDKVTYTTRHESFLTVSKCSPVMGHFWQETGLSQGLYMNRQHRHKNRTHLLRFAGIWTRDPKVWCQEVLQAYWVRSPPCVQYVSVVC